MAIATRLKRYFDTHQASYQIIPRDHELLLELAAKRSQLAFSQVVRATLLEDEKGLILALSALDAMIDIDRINDFLDRNFRPLAGGLVDRIFHDCDPGSHPPFGGAYRLEVIADSQLRRCDTLYFEPGSHDMWVSMTREHFFEMLNPSYCFGFTQTLPAAVIDSCGGDSNQLSTLQRPRITDEDITERLRQVHRLPPMPAIAMKILRLVDDKDATVEQLVELVEQDPSIAAQVLRYAQSPYYGYRGKIDSIQTAIVRVLGFELVSHIAITVSLGQQFNLPNSGPLGLDNYWKHAVYSAVLAQRIALKLDNSLMLEPGMAYMAGLLHNIGVLILGHLFQPEFFLLNKLAATNPNCSIVEIENKLLGIGQSQNLLRMGHAYMGGWLMRYWGMPEMLAIVAENHHSQYQGDHQNYVALMQLVNHLLAEHKIGDIRQVDIPQELLDKLKCDKSLFTPIVERVFEHSDTLNAMAKCFSPS